MKVIFAGTPEFAVKPLLALLEQHEVVAVLTQPDRRSGRGKKLTPPPVKMVAEKNGITVHQPLTLKGEAELIKQYQADVMVVVAYGMLLPQEILDIPRLGCINIHASLLPRWRGAAPIQRAIQAGDQETGVCIMQMEAGLDTGPVFLTLTTAINQKDTSASMHDRLADLGAEGIVQVLNKLAKSSDWQAEQQAHDKANYAHKITKDEANIDWHQSAQQISQTIRAFNPWPVCQSWHNGQRIRFWFASAIDTSHNTTPGIAPETTASNTPGTILNVDKTGILVACGEGQLRITQLQKQGSKALECQQFLNGYQLIAGEQFSATQTN